MLTLTWYAWTGSHPVRTVVSATSSVRKMMSSWQPVLDASVLPCKTQNQ